ncbi:MAG: methionyl-tRNA formyltransferase [Chloroflexi bacterium]|nr:methionyl-tRNA formyltransferase [Chloroflexota bacterium]
MRIVVIGQAAFGEKVTEALLKQGEQVVGIYTSPDMPGRANPLKDMAIRLGIPLLQPQRMRAPEVYAGYVKLHPELNVMAFVTDILPENILAYPKLGTIQYHPSLLPRHRGGSAINWAIIQGDTRTGITIFWPDKGIDTGPILMQKEVEIAPDDTVGSLYFNKLSPLGVEALVESVALVKNGTAPHIPQDESQATYELLCTERHAVIDWSQPVQRVYNLIRGTNPQPGAIAYFRGRRFKIFDSNLAGIGAGSAPGTIVDIITDGFVVAVPGGRILVRRVQPDGAAKLAGADFARQVGLSVGDRLV